MAEYIRNGAPKNGIHDAVIAIMNVTFEDENVKLCDDKVVEVLMRLLEAPYSEVTKYIAGSLANIAVDSDKRKQIIPAVPALVMLLKRDLAYDKKQAAGALMNIVDGNEEVKLQIARLGAIPPLLDLMQSGNTSGKVRAISLLFELWQLNIEEVRRDMHKHGTTRFLADIVANGLKKEKESAEQLLELMSPSTNIRRSDKSNASNSTNYSNHTLPTNFNSSVLPTSQIQIK